MKRIYAIAVLLLLLACPQAQGAISFDAAASTSGQAATFTWSHTVAGSEPALFVAIGIQNDVAVSPVTAVTYNGTAMALARRDLVTFQIISELWYLPNPDGGAHPVTVELSTSSKMACGSISLNGVHQTDPVPTVNGNCNSSAQSGPVTVAITTAFDDSWLLDCMYLASASIPVTANSGQTEQWQDNTGGGADAQNSWGEGSTRAVGNAGSYDASWTWTGAKKWCLSVIEVRETVAVDDGQHYGRLYWRGANSVSAGTLAFWQFENNLVDKTGTYALEAEATGKAACYDQISPPNLSYHLCPEISDVNTCVHTDGAITGTVQTIEFYLYGNGVNNTWFFDGDAGANLCAGVQYRVGADPSFFFNINGWGYFQDTIVGGATSWFHYGITMDGVDCRIYRNNVEVKDGANVYQSVDEAWHFGNHRNHTVGCDIYIDMVRLSSVVRTSFPTLD